MKIEAGRYYKTRDGRTVGPMARGGDETHSYWRSSDELGSYISAWHKDGSFWPEGHRNKTEENSRIDIISPAYPEQGTLKEIGAKPGDVVELVEAFYSNHKGDIGTVSDDATKVVCNDGSGTHLASEDEPYGQRWRIISRASEAPPSPVRTVTTTRQEIVPGRYGKLKVYVAGDFGIDVCTKDELSDAIARLTEIRDAMTA